MGEGGIITTVLVIAVLIGILAAVATGFVVWPDSKRLTAAVFGAASSWRSWP